MLTAKQKPNDESMLRFADGIMMRNTVSSGKRDIMRDASSACSGTVQSDAYICRNATGHASAVCEAMSAITVPRCMSMFIPYPITTEDTAMGSMGSVCIIVFRAAGSFVRSSDAYTKAVTQQRNAVTGAVSSVPASALPNPESVKILTRD